MEKTFLSTSILVFFGFSHCRSCTDKSQTSARSEGMRGIPVVLTIGTLGSDVRLPCRYCSEKVDIRGRKWKRRDMHGTEGEVKLDMHDDDSKNRVFVDKDHSLIIREVREDDAAYYFCYDIEDETGKAKMDLLLDVGYRTPLEPNVLTMPVDLEKEVPKLMKDCNRLRNIPAVSMYECYAEWTPWSVCDTCGKVGKRRRIGECRLQKFVKEEVKTPEGKIIEADFPVVGVGCHSFLLDAIPAAKKILNDIPNVILEEYCEVSCEGYVGDITEMKAYMKSSFLKKIKIQASKKKKGMQQTLIPQTREENEGAAITLFCPSGSLEAKIKWKFKERLLDPVKLLKTTGGRVSIDAADVLHIKDLRITDAGEYVCSLFEVEIGLIRLKVISRHVIFDPKSNFGILSIVMLLSFILWIIQMAIKWKSFMMQRKVQQLRAMREKVLTEEESESQYLLQSEDDSEESA